MKQNMDNNTEASVHQIRSFSLIQQSQVRFSKDCFLFNVSLLQPFTHVCVYQKGEETSFGFKPVILLEWRQINQRGHFKLVYVRNRLSGVNLDEHLFLQAQGHLGSFVV